MPTGDDGRIVMEVGYGLKDTWRAMEALVDKKLTRYIGVSKYNQALMLDLLSYCRIKPHSNQIEVHPRFQNRRLIELCHRFGVKVVAYSPLGSSHPGKQSCMEAWREDPRMVEMARRHGKDIGQVVLRWHLQLHPADYSVLVKSGRAERIRSNLQLHDFELDEAEMAYITAMEAAEGRLTDAGARAGVPVEYN